MQGLDLCRAFFEEYGLSMIEEGFAEVKDRIAAGLVGEGSECLSFDDELSKDHDFSAGFCLWLTEEDYQQFGFRLERAYAHLPKEYKGVIRPPLAPAGGNRHGVFILDDFYRRHIGAPHAPDAHDHDRWLYTPSHAFLCASNGEVFTDPLGKFSEVRAVLQKGYPEDIRRKKLAAHTAGMAQAGAYNFGRSIERGDSGAASLSLYTFIRHAISAIYLLNNRYEPFYKWAFRGMRDLPLLGELGDTLAYLLELDNEAPRAKVKAEVITDVSARLCDSYRTLGLSRATCYDLSRHAYSITDGIKDNNLRNRHIMDGIA